NLRSATGVADADERSLFAAKKAKEQEIIIETERIKADQEVKEAAEAAKAAEEARAAVAAAKAAEEAKNTVTVVKATEGENNPEGRLTDPEQAVIANDDKLSKHTSLEKPSKTTTKKESGKSKTKVIIVVAAVVVLAILGIIIGLTHEGTDTTIQSEDLESARTVSSDELPTELVSADNIIVTAEKAVYTAGASGVVKTKSLKSAEKS
ncbi:MAG: hypothetical protein Q4A40_05655, partial [Bacillota bacterium]|nr:hypothetical protein [Bacillota bacterium]